MKLVRQRRESSPPPAAANSIRSLPAVVFLHGAGFDHSAWALHTRWFAHHGFGVLAPDLPGHGRSQGPALRAIAEMADWTVALLDAAGAAKAHLIGHSMGSLIALETAARHPAQGVGAGPDRHRGDHDGRPRSAEGRRSERPGRDRHGVDLGPRLRGRIGGSLAPGLWMHGGAQRVLQHCAARRAVQRSLRLQRLSECARGRGAR